MQKVTDEALIARLNEIYAIERRGEKEGIEMKQKAWFFDEKNQAFCLRVMYGGKPGAYLHSVTDPSLL